MSPPGALNRLIDEAARFGLVGILNTAVGLAAIYVNIFIFEMNEIAGNLLGYIVGLLFGFAFHRNWTFRATTRVTTGFLKYLLAFAMAYGVNLACVLGLRKLGLGPAWAHASGVVPYVVVFFLLSRYMVFANADASR
jgi:putative flippase GtrA